METISNISGDHIITELTENIKNLQSLVKPEDKVITNFLSLFNLTGETSFKDFMNIFQFTDSQKETITEEEALQFAFDIRNINLGQINGASTLISSALI